MFRFMIQAFLIYLTIASFLPLNARELVTDRPDFTESALVIPATMVQFESGVEYVDSRGQNALTFPQLLTRIGVGYDLEVRLGLTGWTRISSGGQSDVYRNDLLLESKYQLTETQASVPMGLLLVATLPTGDEQISSGKSEYGLKWAASYDLNERTGISANIGAVSISDGNERKLLSLASLAFGFALNDRFGVFIETYAEAVQKQTWQPVLDGGFTFLLTPLLQLDLYAGKGLNDTATDVTVGGGLSFLLGY